MTTKTTKITITKSTVKVVNARDEKEFPRSSKKDGRYVTPWETAEKAQPGGWENFKYVFVPNYSKVPAEDVSIQSVFRFLLRLRMLGYMKILNRQAFRFNIQFCLWPFKKKAR